MKPIAFVTFALAAAACGSPETTSSSAPDDAPLKVVDVGADDLHVASFAARLDGATVYRFTDPARFLPTERVHVVSDDADDTLDRILARAFDASGFDVSGGDRFLLTDDVQDLPQACAQKCYDCNTPWDQLNVCPDFCASLQTGNASNQESPGIPQRTGGCDDGDGVDGRGDTGSGDGGGSSGGSTSGGSTSSGSSSGSSGTSGVHGGVSTPGGGG